MLYVPAAHTVEVAGGHPVQGHGYGAHVVLGQHQRIEPAEGRPVHLRFAQHGRRLLQSRHRQLPQLAVLGGQRRSSVRSQLLRPRRKAPGKAHILQVFRQRPGLPGGGDSLGGCLRQRLQRPGRPAAQIVYPSESLAGLVRIFIAPAARVLPPWPRAGPRAAPQVPHQHIVFQLVGLLGAQTRKAGAKVGENVTGLPAAGDYFVGSRDKGGQRPGHHVAFSCEIQRHAVVGEHALQRRTVVLEAPDGHGDVPPAAARFPGKPDALRGGQFALRRDAGGAVKGHGPAPVHAGGGIGKHVVFKKFQRLFFALGPLEGAVPDFFSQFAGRPLQRAHGGPGHSVHLAVSVAAGEAHGDFCAFFQKLRDHPALLGREISEAVDVYICFRAEIAFRYGFGQPGEPVGRVGAAVGHHGVVGFGNERQIPQLVRKVAGASVGGGGERVGRHAGRFQLVQLGQQQGLHLRAASGRAVHPQA